MEELIRAIEEITREAEEAKTGESQEAALEKIKVLQQAIEIIEEKQQQWNEDKMPFREWLEKVQGISWWDWDEHYCGLAAEEIEQQYEEYWENAQ